MSHRSVAAVLLVLIGGVVSTADDLETSPSSARFLPANEDVREEIQQIGRLVLRQQWRQIVDICHKHISQPTRSVIERDGTYVSPRTVCEERLRGLPEVVRRLYRTLHDPEAAKLYKAARNERDIDAARRLVQSYALTSYGPRGRRLLATLRFQQGRFDAALAQWRSWLDGPEPEVLDARDRRRAAAKIALAAAQTGDRELLDRAARLFGDRGPAVILGSHTLTTPDQLRERVAGRVAVRTVGPTAPSPADTLRWTQPLTSRYSKHASRYHGSSTRIRYACTPDHHRGALFVNTPGGLQSFDALTGRVRWQRALRNYDTDYQAVRPFVFHARVDAPPGRRPLVFSSGGSRFVAHEPDGGRLVWSHTRSSVARFEAIMRDRELRVAFSSPVVCSGGAAFVGLETSRGEVFLMSVDRETGERRWLVQIAAGAGRSGYHVSFPAAVRVHGGDVLFASGHGVIGSCDAATGEFRWLTPYRRRSAFAQNRYYGSAPGVAWSPLCVAGSTVVCSPSDGSQLIAVDRMTGKVRWEKVLDHPARALGVLPPDDGFPQARIVTVGERVACRRIDTGSVVWTWPLPEPCDGLGRLCANGILIPTQKGLYRLRLADGTLAAFVPLPLQQADSVHVAADADAVSLVWSSGLAAIGERTHTAKRLADRLKEDGDDPWVLAAQAELLRLEGRSGDATTTLVRAVDLARRTDPSLAGDLGERLIELYDGRFRADWKAGRKREAFVWLQRALHSVGRTPYLCRVGLVGEQPENIPHAVRLVTGDVLHGTLTAIRDGTLSFVVNNETWSVALAGVRGIEFSAAAAETETAAPAVRTAGIGAKGRVTLVNGDRITGDVESLAEGRLRVEAKFGAVTLPVAGVGRIDFARSAFDQPEKTVYLRLSNGNRLSGTIRSFDGAAFEIDVPFCGRRRIPAEAVYTISNRFQMPSAPAADDADDPHPAARSF
jgi:outer membrane protein assembly factor BamB